MRAEFELVAPLGLRLVPVQTLWGAGCHAHVRRSVEHLQVDGEIRGFIGLVLAVVAGRVNQPALPALIGRQVRVPIHQVGLALGPAEHHRAQVGLGGARREDHVVLQVQANELAGSEGALKRQAQRGAFPGRGSHPRALR